MSVIQSPDVFPVNVKPLNSIEGTLPPVFQVKSKFVPFNVPPVTKVFVDALAELNAHPALPDESNCVST